MSRPWKPDRDQLRGVEWLVQHAEAALLLDPGAGKTSMTYAALTVLKAEGLLHGALVLAPLRPATQVWPAEQAEWSDFSGLSVCVLHGRDKYRLVQEHHDVYVVNYEGLKWLVGGGHLQNLLKNKWIDTIVFDELSKMKNPSKKMERRKLLAPLLPRFARRWGLTGSPASNGLINLFGQAAVLDLGRAFGPYITHFRNRYFVPVGEWNWALKEGADELIYAAIAPLALRMSLSKKVKMPELRLNEIRVELPPEARKTYTMMEDEMLAILDDELVSAGTAGAVYSKCCQITSGALFKATVDPITGEPRVKTGSREWYAIHDEKIDALEELLDELQGQQVLVAYWFRHSLERLQKRFGRDLPYIGSGVGVKRAQEYEASWNAGELPMLLIHPASAAHGLNLQKSSAHHVAWFDLTPDLELFDQLCKRLCRRGNMSPTVFVHLIAAARTVDTWGILPALRRKKITQDSLFEALRLAARARERRPRGVVKSDKKGYNVSVGNGADDY